MDKIDKVASAIRDADYDYVMCGGPRAYRIIALSDKDTKPKDPIETFGKMEDASWHKCRLIAQAAIEAMDAL